MCLTLARAGQSGLPSYNQYVWVVVMFGDGCAVAGGCLLHPLPAAGFSDSVVRVYNLEKMGAARSKLTKQLSRQEKRGRAEDGLEPTIDVDTEMAELQVSGAPPAAGSAVLAVRLGV